MPACNATLSPPPHHPERQEMLEANPMVKDKNLCTSNQLNAGLFQGLPFRQSSCHRPGGAEWRVWLAGNAHRCRETGWWLTNVSRLWNLGSPVRWLCPPSLSIAGLLGGLFIGLSRSLSLSPPSAHISSLMSTCLCLLLLQGCEMYFQLCKKRKKRSSCVLHMSWILLWNLLGTSLK